MPHPKRPDKVPPRHIAEHADAIRYAAYALAESLDHNDNPYRAADTLIDVNTQLPRLLQLYLGEEGLKNEHPTPVDTLSALVGATTVLAISMRHNNRIDWITDYQQKPPAKPNGPS